MNNSLHLQFSVFSTTDLLAIYINKREDYTPEALLTIENILIGRNVVFDKFEKKYKEKIIVKQKQQYPFNKKLFLKVLIVFILLGGIALIGKIVEYEGKLVYDDILMMFLYKMYVVLSIPLTFIIEKLKISPLIFISYIINIFLWARLFTYLITRFKSI